MAEITNFADASRVVYQGSQGIEILPWPKIVGSNTRQRLEMLKITSFADTARVVYQGSQGIEILPWPKIVGYNTQKRRDATWRAPRLCPLPSRRT